jgi:hypothetical protein
MTGADDQTIGAAGDVLVNLTLCGLETLQVAVR